MTTSKSLYLDLWIENGDIVLDGQYNPKQCNNRLSIAQDIKHMILESAILTQMIAERSPILRQDLILQLILLVESDWRLVPGTIEIKQLNQERLFIFAESVEFGALPSMEILINGEV